MKKIIAFLRSYIGHVGAYFLFTMLGFVLFSSALGTAKDSFRLSLVFTSLLFSALCGLCDLVRTLRSGEAVKAVLHAVLTIGSFALSFAITTSSESGKTLFFGTAVFALIYLVLVAVRGVYLRVQTTKEKEATKYTNLYTPKDLD